MKELKTEQNKTIGQLSEENPDKTYTELTKIQEDTRLRIKAKEARAKGVCVTGALKKDLQQNRPLTDTMDEMAYYELKNENEKLKKRAQEAEGELTIIKGIGNTSPEMKALQKRVVELDNSLSIALEQNDKYQREIKNLQWVKEQDYIFLVDENKHLHKEIREIRNDNRKLSLQIEDKLNHARKAGLL